MEMSKNYWGRLERAMFGRVGVLTSDGDVKVIEGGNWENLDGEESLNDLMGKDVVIGYHVTDESTDYFFRKSPGWLKVVNN